MTVRDGPLVLGGGPAGSMAALTLARAGCPVTLLEKSREAHDKVCGDFLSRESLVYLERNGLTPEALGAVPIRNVRLVAPGMQPQESALPFPAWSLTRKVLDESLLAEAGRQGATVVRDAQVMALRQEGSAWVASLRDGRSFCAADVVLATGKLDVNGWPRPQGSQRGLVGFKMYYRLHKAQQVQVDEAVELVVYPGGYAGLQPVQDGLANLTLLIDPRRFADSGMQWNAVMRHVLQHAPHLQDRLHGAVAMLPRPLAVSRIPYGHMQRNTEDGLWRVGDQAAVIPSMCGDGTAIALHSGALAAACRLRGDSAPDFQRRLYRQLSARLRLATCVSRLLVAYPAASQWVRIVPGLLRTVAAATRISDSALRQVREIADERRFD